MASGTSWISLYQTASIERKKSQSKSQSAEVNIFHEHSSQELGIWETVERRFIRRWTCTSVSSFDFCKYQSLYLYIYISPWTWPEWGAQVWLTFFQPLFYMVHTLRGAIMCTSWHICSLAIAIGFLKETESRVYFNRSSGIRNILNQSVSNGFDRKKEIPARVAKRRG